MSRLRFFECAIVALIITFCATAHPALAQSQHHFQLQVVPRAPESGNASQDTIPVALFPLWQMMTTYYIDPDTGVDEWPCRGGQAECPSINPLAYVVVFPTTSGRSRTVTPPALRLLIAPKIILCMKIIRMTLPTICSTSSRLHKSNPEARFTSLTGA